VCGSSTLVKEVKQSGILGVLGGLCCMAVTDDCMCGVRVMYVQVLLGSVYA